MAFMNSTAGDGLPIVKSIGDLSTLMLYDLVELSKGMGETAIAPVIFNEMAFAKDAYLKVVLFKDLPLDAEMGFVTKFDCLSKGICF